MAYFIAVPSCTLQYPRVQCSTVVYIAACVGYFEMKNTQYWHVLGMQLCIYEGRTTVCTKWGCYVEVCHEFYWQRWTMQHQLKIPSTDGFFLPSCAPICNCY